MTAKPPATRSARSTTPATSGDVAVEKRRATQKKRRPRRRTFKDHLRAGLMTAGVVLGLGLIVAAVMEATEAQDQMTLPEGLERTIPPLGSQIQRTDDVGFVLEPGYMGMLLIDGEVIPDDQLVRVTSLGQVIFRPGPDKEFESFEPGATVVLTAQFWDESLQLEQAKAQSALRNYTWTIRVQ
ncbi:MAG: DUF350 domain-containing protein [Acidimicrobiia bacterium]|jgi:hypothetical protein|nr:DUF350 domain-containing protein [Acidimicrobiia bacterium]MBP8181446.1 DUF350 domain-containing protein [Acidimicrobiia bacterium]